MESNATEEEQKFKERLEMAIQLIIQQVALREVKQFIIYAGASEAEAAFVISAAVKHVELNKQRVEYAVQLITKKIYKYSEVKQFIMDEGVSEDEAKSIIAQATKVLELVRKEKAKEQMILGGVLIALGAGTTAFSYFLAWFNNNSVYFIFSAVIIHGTIILIKGFARYK